MDTQEGEYLSVAVLWGCCFFLWRRKAGVQLEMDREIKDKYGNYTLNTVNCQINKELKFPALILRNRGERDFKK